MLVLCLFTLCLAVCAAGADDSLHFKLDGSFKILQIADLHQNDNPKAACQDILPEEQPFCGPLNASAFYTRVIREEDPDLLVFTGDQINHRSLDAFTALRAIMAPVVASGKPWAAVLGNHDGEANRSRREMVELLTQLPNSLTRVAPEGWDAERDGSLGNDDGNYVLTVTANGPDVNGPNNPAAAAEQGQEQSASGVRLWFLDSGNRVLNSTGGAGPYDWVRPGQLAWIHREHARLTRQANVKAQTATNPALAFFHIPVPEYDYLLRDSRWRRTVVGSYQEPICPAQINSGLYSTLLSVGVAATFVGHDHTNDYCGKYVGGVQLCYGGGAGYHTYGKAGWPRRTRVINIEKFGKRVTSWKRLDTQELAEADRQVLFDHSVRIDTPADPQREGPSEEWTKNELCVSGTFRSVHGSAEDIPSYFNDASHHNSNSGTGTDTSSGSLSRSAAATIQVDAVIESDDEPWPANVTDTRRKLEGADSMLVSFSVVCFVVALVLAGTRRLIWRNRAD